MRTLAKTRPTLETLTWTDNSTIAKPNLHCSTQFPARETCTKEGDLKILVYGDLRTHHAQGWIEGLRQSSFEVYTLSSTSEPQSKLDVPQLHTDISARARHHLVSRGWNQKVRRAMSRSRDSAENPLWDPLQSLESVLTAPRYATQRLKLHSAVDSIQPHIVHALRTPYEGLITSSALRTHALPITLSTWGQDFQYQARRDPLLRHWMRVALPRFSGVHVDTPLDLYNARTFGLRETIPDIFAAGNFGVDPNLFYSRPKIPYTAIYPRGLRSYINHRLFLEVVAAHRGSQWRFVGVGLAGDAESEVMARDGSLNFRVTPYLDRMTFAELLSVSTVTLSPAFSDGTPNSLIEAMACGTYLIASDIPSVQALAEQTNFVGRTLPPSDITAWIDCLRTLPEHNSKYGAPSNESLIPSQFKRLDNIRRFETFFTNVAENTSH